MATTNVFALARQSNEKVIKSMRRGITASAFDDVARTMNLPISLLAEKLNLSKRTLDRKRSGKTALGVEDSEKIVRIARIRNLAADVFTDNAAISDWLAKPAPGLGGAIPLDMVDTDLGARDVEALLRGIAHGNVI